MDVVQSRVFCFFSFNIPIDLQLTAAFIPFFFFTMLRLQNHKTCILKHQVRTSLLAAYFMQEEERKNEQTGLLRLSNSGRQRTSSWR